MIKYGLMKGFNENELEYVKEGEVGGFKELIDIVVEYGNEYVMDCGKEDVEFEIEEEEGGWILIKGEWVGDYGIWE